MSCNIGQLDSVISKEGKAIVVVLTPDCPHGNHMKAVLKANQGKFDERKIKVIEVNVEPNKDCVDFVQKLKLLACPTCLFYEKGKETGRFIPAGQTEEEVMKILLDMKK